MANARRRTDAPIAFAHRGASAYAPENTLAAFRLALELGATGLESDVWLAADGVPVLVHDRTIRRPGPRVDVMSRTASELAAFDVPTLLELYAAVGSEVELSLDIEHPEAALPTLEVAVAARAVGALWACSPDLGVLVALRAANADVRLVCSTRPRRLRAGVEAFVAELAEARIDVLNMHWRDWTAPIVELLHRRDLLAFGWDAQDAIAIERLLDLGVDGIYSDRPDRLVAAIGSRRTAAAGA
jgi:glycerophosphoryl diester phosphodiesterase